MALIDKSGLPIDDPWRYPDMPGEPENLALAVVHHTQWTSSPAAPETRAGGIWITADQELSQIEDVLQHVRLIVIEFPKSRDGRGYTLARVLRDRYRYAGDLRAAGPLLPDQFGFLLECGFTSLLASPSTPLERWREAAASRMAIATKPRTLLERLGRASHGKAALAA